MNRRASGAGDVVGTNVDGPAPRVPCDVLTAFVTRVLEAGGMDEEKAADVARIAVEGDMIGHVTHGTGMIPWYLADLRCGKLNGTGQVQVVADRGACFTWRGGQLPGAWLIRRALDVACDRVAQFGVVTAAISDSHHTGALAAYLRDVTGRGYIGIIESSNPGAARMAPFGGTEPLITPDPVAAGFPTEGDPVIVDISCSITTTTMTRQLARCGERYPENWALTADGVPTDDPAEVVERGGSLLPLGGVSKGHKGFGLALIVEMLTQGLSGRGRADALPETSQTLFIQVIDPDAFGGREAFLRQSSWLADACRANRPAPGVDAVRMPGDRAARRRREALARGVELAPGIATLLIEEAARLGVPVPCSIA